MEAQQPYCKAIQTQCTVLCHTIPFQRATTPKCIKPAREAKVEKFIVKWVLCTKGSCLV